jgi:photosystem II stability/assembly factor-like uncharacterized protein
MKSILMLLITFLFFQPSLAQFSRGINVNPDHFNSFQFRSLGPNRGGRVTAVEGVELEPGVFYMGATGGGVWKTRDYGITWQNISDGYFSTPSIGAISVVQSDPRTLYVGTGSDAIRSNVISGKGVYRSKDGGQTWKHLGLTQVGQIGAVEIHPTNPQIVFVAAIGQAFQPNKERGIYRSRDEGEHWELVLHHSDSVGAVDLEFAPDNPNILYGALWRAERKPWTITSGCHQCGGIYKSADGGSTWKKIQNGLPDGLIGKIDLAVSPQDPALVYALIEAPPGEGGLYVSKDYGETFTYVDNSTSRDLMNRPFYYCNVEVNPQNSQTLYVLADGFFKSTDGGKHWKKENTPHGDNHDMWIHPKDSLIFIEANDGGVNITTNGGRTWSTQLNQPTAELYQIEVDDQYPYWVYAGQQDNTTLAVPSLPPYDAPGGELGYWISVGGCETGPAVPKPGNHNIVYSNCKGRFGVYNKLTGQEKQYYVGAANMYGHNPKDLTYRFQRVAPIHVSPHNPDIVYHASQYLHKTSDDGLTWETISPDLTAFTPKTQVISGSPITRDITGEEFYSTIYSVKESSLRAGLIWVGANDGPIHVTRNGGSLWEEVSPKKLLPGGRVNCVEPSPHNESKAYVSVLRYQLGDWKPYIYKTENYGKSWELLTPGDNGIPLDYPTRVIREDPVLEGLLYAGTEYGFFISFDDGKHWLPFQQNLPITPITDLKLYRGDLVLSTMGRSFWALDNVSALHQLRNLTNHTSTVFKPMDTYRFRYKESRGSSVPFYPVPSVIIDYFVEKNSEDELTLDILDSSGKIVRTFTSRVPSDSTRVITSMATHFTTVLSHSQLKKTAGVHRFRWDMRHYGAWDKDEKKRYQGGPLAAPGKYTVRMRLGSTVSEQTFSLLKDPRLTDIDDSVLKIQEQLALQTRNLLDSARRLAVQVQSLRKKMETRLSGSGGKSGEDANKLGNKLKDIENQLLTESGEYMQPMLIDQVSYLGSMLGQADQKPGKDAFNRFKELKNRYDDLDGRFKTLTNTKGNSLDD